MTADILVYTGTLLIAYQMVGDIGHLFVVPLHLLRLILEKTSRLFEGAKLVHGWGRITRKTFSVVIGVLLYLVVVPILAVVLAVTMVGAILTLLNKVTNIAYFKVIDPEKNDYIARPRDLLKSLGLDRTTLSNREIWQHIKEKEFPFTAFVGILILTAGFVLQIRGG